jgi:hypothetical protein
MPTASPDSPATQAQATEVVRLLATVYLRQVQILKLLAKHFSDDEVATAMEAAHIHLAKLPVLQDALSKKLVDQVRQIGRTLESIRWDQ